jgi:hypothetical protein
VFYFGIFIVWAFYVHLTKELNKLILYKGGYYSMIQHIYIYDDALAYYLSKKGHRFETHARHIVTNKEFYQYVSNPKLKRDIERYNNMKLLNV